jgi:predicted choloylglycine hydrolase
VAPTFKVFNEKHEAYVQELAGAKSAKFEIISEKYEEFINGLSDGVASTFKILNDKNEAYIQELAGTTEKYEAYIHRVSNEVASTFKVFNEKYKSCHVCQVRASEKTRDISDDPCTAGLCDLFANLPPQKDIDPKTRA